MLFEAMDRARTMWTRSVFALATALSVVACGGGGGGGDAQRAAALAAAAAAANTLATAPTTPSPQLLSCDDSLKERFRPDGQTTVLLVRQYKQGDPFPSSPLGEPEAKARADLCQVKLLVGPGNPGPVDAPSTSKGIGIEVWLPKKAAWTGRVRALGVGGWAGSEESDLTKISSIGIGGDMRSAPRIAAEESAVTSSSDAGHVANGAGGSFAMRPDGTINTPLWLDFASRGIHEQVVKTKALALAFYGAAPTRTYWDGGSGGGRQALQQAQMYPEDFDGIIAAYPANNWTRFITAELYPQIVVQRDLGGSYMSATQLDLVSNAAIAACDHVGGKHLGYVMDPLTCSYDPTKDASVLCTADGGSNGTSECVSPLQAQAINKVWYGMTSDGSVPDPSADNGWNKAPQGVHRWYGLTRGTSLLALASPAPFSIATDMVALELQNSKLATTAFINATGDGADGWKALSYADLSNAFDQGVALQPRFGNVNADEPDLSAFKARGGKLIQYHGHADVVIPPQGSMSYYERVASKIGGLSAVQDFYRLYLVPGMTHGPGNGTSNPDAAPPYPATGQMHQLLVDWVENGLAPDSVVINSAATVPSQRSQPMCIYPKKAIYKSGDPFVSASYVCS